MECAGCSVGGCAVGGCAVGGRCTHERSVAVGGLGCWN